MVLAFEQAYTASVRSGWQNDVAQREVVDRLSQIGDQLLKYDARTPIQVFFDRLFHTEHDIRGAYIWGGVGRGKTALMDMFFESLPFKEKQRLHFHRFMAFVHDRLKHLQGTRDPLRTVADEFASQTRVLCFDEFFVSDIGDAMVLAELLEALIAQRVILILTSNIEPKHLYKNGLQRSRFLPAIDLIERHTHVIELGGASDYRLQLLQQRQLYQCVYPVSNEIIHDDINALVDGVAQNDTVVSILDRDIEAVFIGHEVAGFRFAAICETNRNSADYIELARLFHTIVLYDIPMMGLQRESSARRFIALIDELYDRAVNVQMYAQACPNDLYQGHLLRDAFQRTISRIQQMQSVEYVSRAHKP